MIAGRGGGTVLAGAMRPAPAPRREAPQPAPAPAAHQVFLKAISQSAAKVKPPPGVEPGVSGKELLFQQSRQFGPGPIKPYLNQNPGGDRNRIPNQVEDSGNGVYRGGWRPASIPTEPRESRYGGPTKHDPTRPSYRMGETTASYDGGQAGANPLLPLLRRILGGARAV